MGIAIIWKRSLSKNIVTKSSRPFTDLNQNKDRANAYELDKIPNESFF
jgi:hypothetical protein